jgi:hypothetical protein
VVAIVSAVLVVAGGLTAIELASSTSAPSLAGESASQVVQAAATAGRQAGSFEVTVTGGALGGLGGTSGGSVYVGPHDALVTSTSDGVDGPMVLVGGKMYVKESSSIFNSMGVDGAMSSLAGRWIEFPSVGQPGASFSQFVSAAAFISNLVELRGNLTTVGSAPGTVAVRGSLPDTAFNEGAGAGEEATLVVSATAPFVPLRVTVVGATGGSYVFSHWGERVKLPSLADAVPWSKVEALVEKALKSEPPPSTSTPPVTVQPGPVPTGTVPAGSVTTVVAGPSVAGVSVDGSEAQSVARRLWSEVDVALHYRDPNALAVVEADPALAVDRVVCEAGCPARPIFNLSAMSVIFWHQTTWPAYFLGTASYNFSGSAEVWSCPKTPCDDTFVAEQTSERAPWKIVLYTSYSGTPIEPSSLQNELGYAGATNVADPAAYLEQYAAYLQSLKESGEPPAETWLQPGPYTTDLESTNYTPPSTYQAEGESVTFRYDFPGLNASNLYIFNVSSGFLLCGQVDWTETIRALPGYTLTQPPDLSVYGPPVPGGTYTRIVIDGIHMDCLLFSPAYPDRAYVIGDDHGETTAAAS